MIIAYSGMTKEEEREALKIILGEAFDEQTAKIKPAVKESFPTDKPTPTQPNTTKSVSSTSPATEESSATLNIGNEADFATKTIPLYICKTCDHEWDSDEWYCVACNTPYRIPNPAQ